MDHDTEPTAETYPECLRGEIVELARIICARRVQNGEDGDAFTDWLAAEAAVLAAHERSPARLMPGGDLAPN